MSSPNQNVVEEASNSGRSSLFDTMNALRRKSRRKSVSLSPGSIIAAMVKKEKGKGDKAARADTSSMGMDFDPDGEKNLEPYSCCGKLNIDFPELCVRVGIVPTPAVRQRAKLPVPGAEKPAQEAKAEKGGKGKKDKEKANEPPPEVEVDENQEPPEPPPKTYVTRERFEYFKPTLQVDLEANEKYDTVTDLYVKGWKIDDRMCDVFSQCLPVLEKLTSLHFWNVGLSATGIATLARFLPTCVNVKLLELDGSPISGDLNEEGQNFYQLIAGEETFLQHLSLRSNQIDDCGAGLLAHSLATPQKSNQRLLTLNLNNNHITDAGAICLANALRMNRTLLSLSLSNNKIGDRALACLGEALSRFSLTHEEIVERRKQISEKGAAERQKSTLSNYISDCSESSSPPPSRKSDKHRPGSTVSHHGDGGAKSKAGGKAGAKGKKDAKEKEETHQAKTKGKKEAEKVAAGTNPKKEKEKKGAAETKEKTKGGKDKTSKGRDSKKGMASDAAGTPDIPELLHPLMDQFEAMDGELILRGNTVLISLNLSNNEISDAGVRSILSAVQYQKMYSEFRRETKSNAAALSGNGLLRVNLQRNKFNEDSKDFTKLTELMQTRDPLYKAPTSQSRASNRDGSPTK